MLREKLIEEANLLLGNLISTITSDWAGFKQTDGTFAIYEGRIKEFKKLTEKGFPQAAAFAERCLSLIELSTNGEQENVGQPQ
jgi:hypothetical protein